MSHSHGGDGQKDHQKRYNYRHSIASMDSNETGKHSAHSNLDNPIDAMGIIMGENTGDSNFHSNNYSAGFADHRHYSDIHPDEKMMRPVKHFKNKQHNDAFTQQSNLLSHRKDRYGSAYSDIEYGSTVNANTAPNLENAFTNPFNPSSTSKSTSRRAREIPIPAYIPNNKPPAPIHSQSLPISSFSENYLSSSVNEDNSVYASSNPSSRRSSAVSSLNDVCFPVESLDEVNKIKKWPNLAVLEEFSNEELEELRKNRSSSASQKSVNTDNVNFEYPIVSNIDNNDDENEPLIVSTNEEIDPINGRLRPKKLSPWDKPAYVSHQDKLTKFRFTYFRENISNTIHSPTISGLLHGGKKFEDLFSPAYYNSSENHTPAPPPIIKTQQQPHTQNQQQPVKEDNSEAASTFFPTASNATEPSIIASTVTSKAPAEPFWLDILNPTEEEMKAISKTFGIHPLTSEDIFLAEAREKVELFRDYYFVCFTSFDVSEEHEKLKRAAEKAYATLMEEEESKAKNDRPFFTKIFESFRRRSSSGSNGNASIHTNSSRKSRRSNNELKRSNASAISRRNKKKKHNKDDLIPLTMYIVVFRDGVITFHFQPTPHTGNVRRRARLLRDYLTISSDWIGYALIDDITDAYAPLIEAIETEVNDIEDEIITMQSGDKSDSSSDESDSDDDDDQDDPVWIKVKRRNSNITGDKDSIFSGSTSSSSLSSSNTKIISWKRKGDMLRRIGDCRRRVMSMLRLLGSKADVIKGFSKRYNEQWEVAPRTEIGLYLGDIQDHIVTMVQNLNHYEKLLARSHSNYLAQINIDMTKVNNDMNDILGKITVLGTIVLPLNIITGLWGMNCLVPGQYQDDLSWFWMIVTGMIVFSVTCYYYVKSIMNI